MVELGQGKGRRGGGYRGRRGGGGPAMQGRRIWRRTAAESFQHGGAGVRPHAPARVCGECGKEKDIDKGIGERRGEIA